MNVAIANTLAHCALCTASQLLSTTTIVAGATPLSATQQHFRSAILMAKSALDGTNNTGDIAIGPSSTNGEQPIVLSPGDTYVLAAPVGAKWNLQDWYFVVTSDNDGVVIIYS